MKTFAKACPGSALVAAMAVVIEMPMIPPACRNMPRRPAIPASSSGASCIVALLVAGIERPMPMPAIAPDTDSQRYGETPSGFTAMPKMPMATSAIPAIMGRR